MSFGQRLEALFRVAQVGSDFCQPGTKAGDEHRGPDGLPDGEPLVDLDLPRLALTLHGQRPPTQERSPGHPEWKALLSPECDGSPCMLVHGRHVSTKRKDVGRYHPRLHQISTRLKVF